MGTIVLLWLTPDDPMLFDTHAHLCSDQLQPDIDQFLADARTAGLVGMVAIGTDLSSSLACVQLARQHDDVYASVGIHPNDAHHGTDEAWNQIVKLAGDPRVVAIGETGLDRHWDDCPFEIQQQWLTRHVDLSFATDKPLVIHMRDCETEMIETLESHARDGQITGIMHSFTGSAESATRAMALGMYISFAGMVTFKKSDDLREVASTIPDDRLLIETDCPYLSPHPVRGKRPNQPAFVAHTADCLATVRGCSVAELAAMTTANARRVFGIR